VSIGPTTVTGTVDEGDAPLVSGMTAPEVGFDEARLPCGVVEVAP
jgi:hypothetical protein